MTLSDLPLAPFERALCDSLQRLAPQTPLAVLALCALCSEALGRGDVCLPLAAVGGRKPWPDAELQLPPPNALADMLRDNPLIGTPGEFKPFILHDGRLYLARYEAYERQLAEQLLARSQAPMVDEQVLQDSLARLFAGNTQTPDWQRLAAAQAVRNRVSVISGGPGTGKTTTVVRLLAALLEQRSGHAAGSDSSGNQPADSHPGAGGHLAIGLAAPTGKAAARMAEAIRQAKADLPISEALKAMLPEQASTLHRLLGAHGDSPQVRYHAANPLALDVLVVDEASMIDLAMMAKLIEALPAGARLILLGDKDQLSAVEAGAVFAELCEGRGFDARTASALTRLTGQVVGTQQPRSRIGSQVVLLTHSHRFKDDSGIGHLARAINAGDLRLTRQVLGLGYLDLIWNQHPSPAGLQQRMADGYAPYLEIAASGGPAESFAAFNRFRVLTAQREGPWGVHQLNDSLEVRLRRLRNSHGRWYAGRAVMVSHNDYGLGLFNGDVGLCLNTDQGLRVFFEAEQGFRSLSPARLPAHEAAFAMTVHKSQGSEFSQVLLVLPDQPSPLLSRSLFYTGITRARDRVEIWASAERLADAVQTRAERAAGLARRLSLDAAEAAPQSVSAVEPDARDGGQFSLF